MEILNSVASKIGDYLVELTIRQVGYLFRFKNIVEDLKKENENLKLRQDRVQQKVEGAIRNAEEIEKDVQKWLEDVENAVADVQKLEDEIQGNKTCFNGWCPNWCWRYRLSRQAAKKTTIVKLLENVIFDGVSHRATLSGVEFFSGKDYIPFESTKTAFDQIMEALKGDESSMIGLCGMGGVGKTTMANEVCKRAKEERLFDEVAMAVVSQTTDLKKIQGQVAELLDLKLEDESEVGRARRLCLRLKSSKKILIILDDVWKELNLADVGIPFGNEHKGCKILITTRRRHVCVSMGSQRIILLNVLSEEEGWSLFKNSAGLRDGFPTMNHVAMEISRECKGLPIAIVTLGRALQGKTPNELKAASQQLKMSKLPDIEDVNDDRNAYGCLKLSYDYLKSKETKLCFLLCSLFPEDSHISVENLVRYAVGLGLYQGVGLIDEARIQVCAAIDNLKSSCLLLDSFKEEHVKMHDVVRDFALWIASKEENVFLVRAGIGLKEWPTYESFGDCTAISLMGNIINELPNGLVCPKLEISLLSVGHSTIFPDAFFEGMKTLKVLILQGGFLVPQSLQSLTNLRTLELFDCKFNDISSLGKLQNLQILRMGSFFIEEMPKEIGELNKLRLLDLSSFYMRKGIPSNLIRRLSRLEELYIEKWEVEGTSTRGSNASLTELNSLSRLAILDLSFDSECLPKGFAFSELLRNYNIFVNFPVWGMPQKCRNRKTLKFKNVSSVKAFKELFPAVEYLSLERASSFKNIIPKIDQSGLNELISLELGSCDEMEFFIDTTHQKDPTTAFCNLVSLSVYEMRCLKEMCNGRPPEGFLQKLRVLQVSSCNELEYVFPISVARNLVQLQEAVIGDAPNLKQAFGKEGDVVAGEGNETVFRQLKKLTLVRLEKLSNFCPENYVMTWPSLEVLVVVDCPNLSQSFIADLEAKMPTLIKKLRVLNMQNCGQFANKTVYLLPQGLSNLKNLTIGRCGEIEEVFQLKGLLPYGGEHQMLLSSLEVLCLNYLPELSYIWKGPTEILGLQNLTLLEVTDCKRLKHIFSPGLARNLLQINRLLINGCEELEDIIAKEDEDDQILSEAHSQPICFPQLREINIQNCNKLRSIFPVGIARGLSNLETLKVKSVSQLTEVFGHNNEADTRDEKEIMLPLSILSLQKLPNLINFYPMGYYSTFSNLEELSVKNCLKIATSFFATPNDLVHAKNNGQRLHYLNLQNCGQLYKNFVHLLQQGQSNLKDLRIGNCGEVEELFKVESRLPDRGEPQMLVSSLTSLTLNDLPQLSCIWKGHTQILSLKNLSMFEVTDCKRLKHIFSHSLAQSLEKVICITIRRCDELEQIIAKEDEDDQIFPQLGIIEVENCNKLRSLFPVSIARGLQCLKKLIVNEASQLEEVFADEDEKEAENEEIVLPLYELSLKELPSLINFCPVRYHFISSHLQNLTVKKCPKLTTSFTIAPNGFVHAKTIAKAPQKAMEDIKAEYPFTHKLPSYIEES